MKSVKYGRSENESTGEIDEEQVVGKNMEKRVSGEREGEESGEQQTDNVYHARDRINERKKSKTDG